MSSREELEQRLADARGREQDATNDALIGAFERQIARETERDRVGYVDKVIAAAGLPADARGVVEALLPTLVDDVAPYKDVDRRVGEAVEKLRTSAPILFRKVAAERDLEERRERVRTLAQSAGSTSAGLPERVANRFGGIPAATADRLRTEFADPVRQPEVAEITDERREAVRASAKAWSATAKGPRR